MAVRALTGAAYVALTLGAAWAGPFTTFLLFLPVAVISAFELHRLLWEEGYGPPGPWSMLSVAALYSTASLGLFNGSLFPWSIVAVGFLILLLDVTWMLKRRPVNPANDLGGSLILMILVALPFGAMINMFEFGKVVFVGFMVMLWTADTGAYLVGRAWGRNKLMPSVSPNKTVEGFVGGVLSTMAVAYVFARRSDALDLPTWLACGAIVSVTSTLGDLLESALKRSRGVKDSGSILPGHGGMLDRFDGALLAAPAMLTLLMLMR
jgi:phosphatidate cytidylyltransferase